MTDLRRANAAGVGGAGPASPATGFQGSTRAEGTAACPGISAAPANLGKFRCTPAESSRYFGVPRGLLARRGKDADEAAAPTPDARAKVAVLVKELNGADDDVSVQALHKLAAMGKDAEAAVPSLARLLERGPIAYKWLAVSVLGKIGSKGAVRVLTRVVEDQRTPNWALSTAIYELENLGPRARGAVPALAKRLVTDPDPKIRRAAVYALQAIGTERAASVLKERVRQDNDASVRQVIAFALDAIRRGSTKNPREVVKDSIAELADDNVGVRYSAARRLCDMGADAEIAVPVLSKVVLDRGGRPLAAVSALRGAAAKALGEIGSENAVPVLVKVVEEKASAVGDQQVRLEAIRALQMLGKKARAAARTLEKVAGDANEPQELRRDAIVALYIMEATESAPTLRRALRDRDAGIRAQAAFALGFIGDREAVGELARMKNDADAYVRDMADQALRTISANGGPKADQPPVQPRATVPALVEKLKERDPLARIQALKALGERGDEAIVAFPAIKGALGDGDPRVRAAASQALKAIGASIMNLGKKDAK